MKRIATPTRSRQLRSRRQAGFTLIELLVVISIIATLMALILPGIQNAREAARRAECLNNMRNVSLAIQNFSSSRGGAVPFLTTGVINSSTGVNSGGLALDWGITGTPALRPAPWTVQLLPLLDNAPLYERLLESNNDPGANSTGNLAATNIEILVCPNDPDSESPGNITYVANAGYAVLPDWIASNSQRQMVSTNLYGFALADVAASEKANQGTGVFSREANFGRAARKMTLDFISRGDGQSNTVLLSENLNARPIDATSGEGGWSSRLTGDIAFMLAVAGTASDPSVPTRAVVGDITATTDGVGTNVVGAKQNGLNITGFNTLAGGTANSKINANLNTATDGQSPRPSSLHPGIVNMMFCDGSGKTINQSIADVVYANLLSSNGGDYGQPILGSSSF